MGKPDVRPNVSRYISQSWFGEAHKRVLRQLLEAVMRQARQKDKSIRSFNEDGAAESRVVVYDMGGGTGAVTEFVMQQMETNPHPMQYGASTRLLPCSAAFGTVCGYRACGTTSLLPWGLSAMRGRRQKQHRPMNWAWFTA